MCVFVTIRTKSLFFYDNKDFAAGSPSLGLVIYFFLETHFSCVYVVIIGCEPEPIKVAIFTM